jgi:hypothetical protein
MKCLVSNKLLPKGDFTENYSLNVINAKQYPMLRRVMNSSPSAKFTGRRATVVESDHSPQKLRPEEGR